MLTLTDEQLAKLAACDSLTPGFDRNMPSCPAESEVVEPLIRRLSGLPNFAVRVFERAEMGTYYSLIVYDATRYPVREGHGDTIIKGYKGLCVWLSLLAPYAVCGRSRFYQHEYDESAGGSRVEGSYSGIDLDSALDAPAPDNVVEQSAFAAIREAGYVILTRAELGQPLPTGIEPLELDFGRQKSSYTLFDALFQLAP